MLNIERKLNEIELERLRAFVDQRSGMRLASERIGVTRMTVHKLLIGGTCSDETAEKVRKFLKMLKTAK